MGASRTSNKDVLNAIEAMGTSIVDALQSLAAPPKVDEAYLAHMNLKAAAHATKQNAEVVLYSRRNKSNQTKLAYALRSRFEDTIKAQPSCLGVIGTYKP